MLIKNAPISPVISSIDRVENPASHEPSQPGTEVQQYGYGCDGLDNDCNGKFDDHACSDQYDKQLGYDYCCTDGYFYECVDKSQVDSGYYTSCKLAN